MLPLAVDEAMVPPVALLVYSEDEVQRAAFYPFASFSPEWQALRYALTHDLPVHFMDLPVGVGFALKKQEEEKARLAAEENPSDDSPEVAEQEPQEEDAGPQKEEPTAVPSGASEAAVAEDASCPESGELVESHGRGTPGRA